MPTATQVATINELKGKRAKCLDAARKIVDDSKTAGREALLAEEKTAYEKAMADFHTHGDQLKIEEELAAHEDSLKQSTGRKTAANPPGALGEPVNEGPVRIKFRDPRTGKADAWEVRLMPGSPGWQRCQPQYKADFRNWLACQTVQSSEFFHLGNLRSALQTDIGTAGGYLVLPEEFNAELIRQLNDLRWMRKISRVLPPTNAQSLGTPKRTAKMSTFAWGSELSVPSADTKLTFGKRSLIPHYMTGEILVSRDLLRAAVLDPEAIMMFEVERDSGELEENAMLTGTGNQQPLGVFTASTDGISTARDISTGNTTTTIGADALRNCKYNIRAQYRNSPSIGWIFHRTAVNQISVLKDAMGQYLWREGLVFGDPDRLLNYPVYESEFAPNTFTTGQYVGLLGDFMWYWVVDGLEMDMQRLVEKYAENNQVAYLTRRKVDAAPMLEDAFSRLKLA